MLKQADKKLIYVATNMARSRLAACLQPPHSPL